MGDCHKSIERGWRGGPDWLKREIKYGLQALVVLGLEGQPAEDVLPKTADIWLGAILRGRVCCLSETIDAPRIREGFSRLISRVYRWPAPAQLIELVPADRGQLRLEETTCRLTDAEWERNQKCIELAADAICGKISRKELREKYTAMGIPMD